jgi:serine-type D-Ala-D-Ala carboxypeptidase/endopeptidase (penicillin-binding protein 4)
MPDVPVLPASTTKIVTAAAALLTLGEDRSLLTRAEVTGPIEAGGVVTGDLLLVGGGDPALATDEYIRWIYPARPATRLSELADQIVGSGVRRITGDLVGVSEGFPGDRLPTGWPDEYFATLDARYIDGLTVDAGLRTIVTFPRVGAGADGGGAGPRVRSRPRGGGRGRGGREGAGGRGRGRGGRGRGGDRGRGRGGRPRRRDQDDGPLADDGGRSVPTTSCPNRRTSLRSRHELGTPRVIVDHTPDPPLHAASELARMLRDRGIVIDGEVRSGPPVADPIGRVARVASPTIEELLRFAVSRSDNHMSDQLFRVVGRTRTGEGSWRESDRAIRQVLDRLGVDARRRPLRDGSGLSRDSRVTARLLIDLDRAMQTTRHRARWMELMAVTGERGTLSERLVGTPGSWAVLRQDRDAQRRARARRHRRRRQLAGLPPRGPHQRCAVRAAGVARSLQDDLILRLVADLDANAQPATEPALDETTEEPPDGRGGYGRAGGRPPRLGAGGAPRVGS